MSLALDHPLLLLLLIGCVPVLLGRGNRWLGFASLIATPRDRASDTLDITLRLLAAMPIACIVIGLAGLHQRREVVQHTATGAHIIVVLDRSLSMDEKFALQGERATESKTAAASRMIGDFFARSPHDRFGLVAFSTAPILSMPLTEHRPAVAAAIRAMNQKALGNTDIGAGIAMALSQFAHDQPDAAHVILLVTDGAGEIPERIRMFLRTGVAAVSAHLYYLYLRSGDDPPLAGNAEDTNMEHPAGLDAFFRSLDIPYAAFEAQDADAIAAATRKIAALETHPLTYSETLPRRDLARLCYLAAGILLFLSLLAQLAERGLSPLPEPAPR
jgi:mxaC protein